MSQSPDFSRFFRAVAMLLMLTFGSQTFAAEAILVVNRVATDHYAVVRAPGTTPIGNDVVIKTKYCHEYSRNEDAVLVSAQDGSENALLFASGAQCEVVAVTKESDRSFNLIEFLIQVGLMALTGKSRAAPKPKRN